MTTLSLSVRSSLLRRAGLAIFACALATSAHAEETDPKSCHYLKSKTVPVRYSGPGLGMTMDGRINGTPAALLVNTGSYTTMLTLTGVEKRGIKLEGWRANGRGIGGGVRMYSTYVDEFIAGPAHSTGLVMSVLGDEGPLRSYDGILGAPFLLQADLEVNLAAKTLSFFRGFGPACKTTYLAYWDPAATVVPFERGTGPNPHFIVLLNGRKFSAVINTGASVSSMSRDTAEAIGLDMEGPGVEKLGQIGGLGEERVARWAATVDKLEIGNEAITHARIEVLDARLGSDVILGADFLRSHRVLMAMSQQKLYISYIGGQPLGIVKGIAPWLAKEADEGNGDAQMVLARHYQQGLDVARDPALARNWLDRAAANDNTEAALALGEEQLTAGQYGPAAAHLRKALDKRPGDRYSALMLHAARLGNKEGELGRRELEQAFAQRADIWPGPVAQYYLGKIDRDKLLEEAREYREHAKARTCMALAHIAAQLRSTGDEDGAKAALAQRGSCLPPPSPATS